MKLSSKIKEVCSVNLYHSQKPNFYLHLKDTLETEKTLLQMNKKKSTVAFPIDFAFLEYVLEIILSIF